MPNDKVLLHCTTCDEVFLVEKYYPSCDMGQISEDRGAKIIEFMRDHLAHHPGSLAYAGDLDNNPGLEFITEAHPAHRRMTERIAKAHESANLSLPEPPETG